MLLLLPTYFIVDGFMAYRVSFICIRYTVHEETTMLTFEWLNIFRDKPKAGIITVEVGYGEMIIKITFKRCQITCNMSTSGI